MKKPIYLDYAATTPVDPRVAEAMSNCLTLDGVFANPASRSHIYGWRAEEMVEKGRRQVADLIGADPREIVWTSGATEADNLAIKGVASRYVEKGRHIITSAIEHKAVLDPCAYLEKQGYEVTYLKPDKDGVISLESVRGALRDDTVLVSLMHANNELGSVNDIQAIGELLRGHQAFFHVDAAQSVGKLVVDMKTMPVDLLSCCAHKIYGPKGIGALYVRRNPFVGVDAQIHGGGHERGMRSGTLPTHQIVGMGVAFELAGQSLMEEAGRLTGLRDRLWRALSVLPEIHLNGSESNRLPGTLNISFGCVDGESLLMAMRDLAVSTGSACTSASLEPSYVLRGIGVPDELALSSLRISMGRFTQEEDVDVAADVIITAVNKLRELSPAWKAKLGS
ncbi:IscS subfamily cysteine desulfurase [Hahella sp. KA22]|uniref:IscS subfamily cysteine desulfurase n=1 Tax=Hahella sp. KA22 TaxID=1628392 RepID=UPI000FDEDE12|nr:IscS subfamily cysteine desulfurase [Hahella sp. KA22]AZZ93320.1 IscS subfamily cysteine desulfurase [Hahella sp. KA22]QAY56694.1 IscS subfamily cysteine desulfurase [Hahella sp. KA22]